MKKDDSTPCCGEAPSERTHPDHTKEQHRINRISGQLEGVRRMILEREYCPKILTQIQAIRAALKSLESVILEKHLNMCVRETFSSKDEKEARKKMEELIEVLRHC